MQKEPMPRCPKAAERRLFSGLLGSGRNGRGESVEHVPELRLHPVLTYGMFASKTGPQTCNPGLS